MEEIDNMQALLDAGAAIGTLRKLDDDGLVLVIPEGYKVISAEQYRQCPYRKFGIVKVTDTQSLIFYATKHGYEDYTVIYADIDAEASRFSLVALLNDHGTNDDEQSWGDHRCLFEPTQAVEWRRWTGSSRKVFSQADFATWLEDNLADVAAVDGMPTGADILTMALGFEATADKRLRSKLNLQSGGVQFEFVDDEDKDTRTRMQVFERFTLGLPVFEASTTAYQIEARLKYREKDGRVTFWYELIRPDRVFKAAIDDEMSKIKEATGFPVIAGTPRELK